MKNFNIVIIKKHSVKRQFSATYVAIFKVASGYIPYLVYITVLKFCNLPQLPKYHIIPWHNHTKHHIT